MRMNAETMQRNGIVHATAQDLLRYGSEATVEQIAAVSGFASKDVEKAIKSLVSQKVMEANNGTITEVRAFKPC